MTMAETMTPATRAKSPIHQLQELLESRKGSLAALLPRHLTADRLMKVAINAASRNPLILKCTPASVVKAVMQGAELGLEVGSALGEYYLVPFKNNKTGNYEAQGIPGYRGLISLARRTGEIAMIFAAVVKDGDEFTYQLGSDPLLMHRPNLDADENAPVKWVYAVAKLKDGSTQFEVMSRKAVEGIRSRSRAGQSGPWVTDWNEMAKKTVIKRLTKYLPLSVELAKALEVDNKADGFPSLPGEVVIDAPDELDHQIAGALGMDSAEDAQPEGPKGNADLKASLKGSKKPAKGAESEVEVAHAGAWHGVDAPPEPEYDATPAGSPEGLPID
jgi:recombination protein RecT